MYSATQGSKVKKGSVQFKNTKGWLQIVFSYPVEVDGETRRKRFYISTEFKDTPLNRQRVGDTIRAIERDIDYGEVDLSLQKYQTAGSLTTVSPISPEMALDEIWEKDAQFKQPQISPSTYAKDFTKQKNHISRFPSRSLDEAILIRDYKL